MTLDKETLVKNYSKNLFYSFVALDFMKDYPG